MKKTKLLVPLMSLVATTSVVAPLVSCSCTNAKTYKISFDAGEHGHFSLGALTEFDVKEGETIGSITQESEPIPDQGWHFTKWDKTDDTVVTSDMTITALYAEDPVEQCTVKFAIDNHGTLIGETTKVVEKGTWLRDVKKPEVKTEETFQFAGWDTPDETVIKSDITVTAKITQDANVLPLKYLKINEGIFQGLTVDWTDPSIEEYTTLFIPNNVVEIPVNLTVPSNSPITKLVFEEGDKPLYLSSGAMHSNNKINELVLPKRLAYITNYAFRTWPALATIDISSWDDEKFNKINPFNENYCFEKIAPEGKLVIKETSTIYAYYTFININNSFEKWHVNDKSWKDIINIDSTSDEKFSYDKVTWKTGSNEEKRIVITGLKDGASFEDHKLTISSTFTDIAPKAFQGLDSNVTTVEASQDSKLEIIGAYAFSNNANITKVDLSKATNLISIENGVFYQNSKLAAITLPSTDTLEFIGSSCFGHCISLDNIDLSQTGISKISVGTFAGCRSLTNILLRNKEQINWIGAAAFQTCISLIRMGDGSDTTVNIPNKIEYIGASAFENCTKCTITFEDINQSELSYIGYKAFYGCNNCHEVYVPKKVRYVGDGAFGGNPDVRSIGVAPGNVGGYYSNDNYLYNYDNELVAACNNSGNFTNKVTTIRPYALSYITFAAETLDLSKTQLTTIGDHAFDHLNYATADKPVSVILPKTIKEIGKSAFQYTNIIDINFGDLINLQEIPENLFDGNIGLTEVIVPNGIRSIPGYTFRLCSKLSQVTIPNTVTSIGVYAFQGCPITKLDLSSFTTFPSSGFASSASFLNVSTSRLKIRISNMGDVNNWINLLQSAGWTGTLTSKNFYVE